MAFVVGHQEGEESASVKIVWSPRAIRHLVAIREYIEKDSEQSAALVAARILEVVDLLQSHPNMGRPGRLANTRELVISGTPYIIPYRVHRERIELMAVFDSHRQWPDRL